MTSKNNWFTTNLGNRSKDNLYDFKAKMSPYEVSKGTFKQNCTRSVLEISNTYDKLYLCYSGGLDSEFVLKLFIDNKLPITPIIVSTPFNTRESVYAFKFCANNNIVPIVVDFSKNDIIDKMSLKSYDRGLFALLGGLPLVVCDIVNELGGHLITGYGDPFSVIPGVVNTKPVSTSLEFSEWDYYLDTYDSKHPSGFFTYDQGVLYSLTKELNYGLPLQEAKHELYQLEPRIKIFWDKEFYSIFRELIKGRNSFNYSYLMDKEELFNILTAT